MLLENKFFDYQITEKNETSLNASIRLNPQHTIYQGHFPEKAIVPGVCQIEMIKEIIANEFGKKLLLSSARDIKFVTMIEPQKVENLQLEIQFQQTDNSINFSAILQNESAKFTKIRASLSII